MQVPRRLAGATLVVGSLLAQLCQAQDPAVMYTDPETGIKFATWTHERTTVPTAGGFTFGMALPSDAADKDATEYIGLLRCSSSGTAGKGWCGVSHGESGQMTAALLLMAWPYNGEVLTSFRYADGYFEPKQYNGDAVLTQIRSKVDENGYEILYRCQNCFQWDFDGSVGAATTSQGYLVLGRAQSSEIPTVNTGCPSKIKIAFHNDGFGQWGASVPDMVAADYSKWTSLATKSVKGYCDAAAAPAQAPPVPADEAEEEPAKEDEDKPVMSVPLPGKGKDSPAMPRPTSGARPSKPAPPAGPPAHHGGWGGDDDDDDDDDDWRHWWDDDEDDEDEDEDDEEWSPHPWPTGARPTAAKSARPTVSRSARPSVSRPARPSVSRSARPSVSRSARPTMSRSARPTYPESESRTVRPPMSRSSRSAVSRSARPTPSDRPTRSARPTGSAPAVSPSASRSAPVRPSIPPRVSASSRSRSGSARPTIVRPSGSPSGPAVGTPTAVLTIVPPASASIIVDSSSQAMSPTPLAIPETIAILQEQATSSSASASASASDSASASATPTVVEPTPSASAVPQNCNAVSASGDTYDYIIVGAGAGGIPVADKLSEAGHSVLLIEKGPPSTARWGGTMKPEWLKNENLTRFDVPGLCNQIWIDPTGVACTDTDQMAGCVLGGGIAVNAGLWWKPYPDDWDANFPAGWHATDVAGATDRVFKRIPGTSTPSMDGKRYEQEGFEVLAAAFDKAGWKGFEDANVDPTAKNHTYAHTTFMFSGGERGGPLATYLATAATRKGFTLWTDTTVNRVVRNGGHATGVELSCTSSGGRSGTVNLTPNTGRVILSAGSFGSAKLLFRSGIGPADQLRIVASSEDGPTMVANASWIELPVGYNLIDHTNTDTVVDHPNVVQYNYTKAWLDPVPGDAARYLANRTGVLAQAAPNIGPMMWDQIPGADGTVRQLQWTSRMEGSLGFFNSTTITMSQYLGRGTKSRGRMQITRALTTRVSTVPYLRDREDVQAVIRGLDNMRNALKDVPGLRWISPAPNVTSEEYVSRMLVTTGMRRSNHWVGTNKMGLDDGRTGGTAVVDTNAKVYGTDNIFVVDASIIPGMMTGNPSAMIVIMAEHAAEKILALPTTGAASSTPPPA